MFNRECVRCVARLLAWRRRHHLHLNGAASMARGSPAGWRVYMLYSGRQNTLAIQTSLHHSTRLRSFSLAHAFSLSTLVAIRRHTIRLACMPAFERYRCTRAEKSYSKMQIMYNGLFIVCGMCRWCRCCGRVHKSTVASSRASELCKVNFNQMVSCCVSLAVRRRSALAVCCRQKG